jgi:hypothetical protein
VKKVDYYAIQQPWRMPKWLGLTLGGVFGAIAIGAGVLIVQLTKAPTPAPAAVAAAPAAPAVAQAAPEAAAAAEPAANTEVAQAAPAKASSHHARHHDKHAKATKSARMATARHSTGLTDAKAHAILAKHDDRGKRRDKDALDKLLGL